MILYDQLIVFQKVGFAGSVSQAALRRISARILHSREKSVSLLRRELPDNTVLAPGFLGQ